MNEITENAKKIVATLNKLNKINEKYYKYGVNIKAKKPISYNVDDEFNRYSFEYVSFYIKTNTTLKKLYRQYKKILSDNPKISENDVKFIADKIIFVYENSKSMISSVLGNRYKSMYIFEKDIAK